MMLKKYKQYLKSNEAKFIYTNKIKVKRTIGLKNLALNSFIGILNLGIC